MNKDAIIKMVNEQMWAKTDADVPQFQAGDTITVTYKIVEGNKERLQSFRGVVIQIKGSGKTKMFTIRKVSNGVGVERISRSTRPTSTRLRLTSMVLFAVLVSTTSAILPVRRLASRREEWFRTSSSTPSCTRKTLASSGGGLLVIRYLYSSNACYRPPLRLEISLIF